MITLAYAINSSARSAGPQQGPAPPLWANTTGLHHTGHEGLCMSCIYCACILRVYGIVYVVYMSVSMYMLCIYYMYVYMCWLL
ncbi:hypothetical protein EON63_13755 [archaeon]|nr:MAG: hypothetical protein EON63_13755 [archaeon]